MQIFWHVVMPAALPSIATGLAIGMGVSWFSLLAGEIISGQYGIGYFTWNAYSLINYPDIVVGMLVIGSLGTLSTHGGAQAHAALALLAKEIPMSVLARMRDAGSIGHVRAARPLRACDGQAPSRADPRVHPAAFPCSSIWSCWACWWRASVTCRITSSPHDWFGNVSRIVASTGSISDMLPIVLNEWLLEIGYMNYAYGRGVSEWSLLIIPHKVAIVTAIGALIGLNFALIAEQAPAGTLSAATRAVRSAAGC